MQPASVVMHIECEAKCEVLPWPVIMFLGLMG